MKRGDKVVVFVDLLGFSRLTEQWPREFVHRRHGSIRSSGTSEARNRLQFFHSVLDQTVEEFTRFSNSITAMSFSDCALVLAGNAYLTADFAAELMQHFVRAHVPVRMGIAAGTFWPGRRTSDNVGSTAITRAIFHGTAIVRAHKSEDNGKAGMRIFLHESLDGVPNFGSRPILRFPTPRNGVFGELSYLYNDNQYRNAARPVAIEKDDLALWTNASILRARVDANSPRRVHRQYTETLAALKRMRQLTGRTPFKRWRPES